MDATTLSNQELLTVLVGRKKAQQFNTKRLSKLVSESGMTPPHPKLMASLELARRVFKEELLRGACLGSYGAAKRYLQGHFYGKRHECFVVLFLDIHLRVLHVEELFRGSINGAVIYPREVARLALKYDTAACIFAHNHPSGVAEPSEGDIKITKRLKNALGMLDINTVDHLIVAGNTVVSMAERKMI